jgi:lipopolysaccharide transport system ATP-binding protein
MSVPTSIAVQGLGKKYIIGHEAKREKYVALRDVLARQARQLLSKARDLARGEAIIAGDVIEEFWALKDINFEVKKGEVLGIIGRNGAGKSTLLKILSRITEPSEGRATINGRVSSLLEVGTGFHPELSGRENIFLNGAILGMTRSEIRRKFDEIVAFAEVEKFLDTPVKRYSSGMYVRLAFAVAAHLEPEILIVDEVLAVGDTEFQKKCMGRMSEVAGGGRTVLFVSHNLDAVRKICSEGILLVQGRMECRGPINECIERYVGRLERPDSAGTLQFPPSSDEKHHIVDIKIFDENMNPIAKPSTWQPVIFAVRFYSPRRTPNGAVTLQISTRSGFLITFCSTRPDQNFELDFEEGENTVYLKVQSLALSSGAYVIGAGLAIANSQWLYNEPHGAVMEVASEDVYNAGLSPAVGRYPVPMKVHWAAS